MYYMDEKAETLNQVCVCTVDKYEDLVVMVGRRQFSIPTLLILSTTRDAKCYRSHVNFIRINFLAY